jgi:hypothetical protein
MVNTTPTKRRKPQSIPLEEYARTIAPKVALHYKEIFRFGVHYAVARLRRPKSKHSPHLSDLVPNNAKANAYDLAAEAFKKLLSGERQDWDGNPQNLQAAVGSCINSMLSGRLKRDDNVCTTYLEDIELDWLYSTKERIDPYLEPAEEYADRHSKAKVIRRLLPANGYGDEGEILTAMIIHRAFDVDKISDLTGMDRKQIATAFMRLAEFVQTEQFAIQLTKVLGDSVARPIPHEIQSLAAEIIQVRLGRK